MWRQALWLRYHRGGANSLNSRDRSQTEGRQSMYEDLSKPTTYQKEIKLYSGTSNPKLAQDIADRLIPCLRSESAASPLTQISI